LDTVEFTLLILIAIYIFLSIILGLIRGWKYLRRVPNEEMEKEYHFHNERVILILAGFSLTALSIVISQLTVEPTELSSTLIFFSLALCVLILSSIALRLRVRRFSIYLSDVLLNAGLLSIGCGFLIFFAKTFSWFDISTIIFTILVVLIFLATLVNYFYFDRYMRYWRGNKRSEQQQIKKED